MELKYLTPFYFTEHVLVMFIFCNEYKIIMTTTTIIIIIIIIGNTIKKHFSVH